MATITLTAPTGGATMSTKQWKAVPTLISHIIDYADVLALKGSALAAADVVESIRIPAGCMVLMAGLQQIVAANSTTLTLHLGVDSDNDGYVASYNAQAGTVGAYATSLYDPTEVQVFYTAADSLDVTFATLTGTLTAGKIRVFALILDVTGEPEPGIATYTN